MRLEIVCGDRALRLFHTVYEQNRAVGQALSVKMDATAHAVARLVSELGETKARAAELEELHFLSLAKQYAGLGDTLLFSSPLQPDAVRRLADAVAKQCGGLAAVFAGEEGAYHYALVHAGGADLASLVKAMNAALRGRGGGRGGFAQGSASAARQEIEAFFGEKAAL